MRIVEGIVAGHVVDSLAPCLAANLLVVASFLAEKAFCVDCWTCAVFGMLSAALLAWLCVLPSWLNVLRLTLWSVHPAAGGLFFLFLWISVLLWRSPASDSMDIVVLALQYDVHLCLCALLRLCEVVDLLERQVVPDGDCVSSHLVGLQTEDQRVTQRFFTDCCWIAAVINQCSCPCDELFERHVTLLQAA